MKKLIIIFFLISTSLLFCQVIIDSVYANPTTDGFIYFITASMVYHVNGWSDLHIGDQGEPATWIQPYEPNSHWRSFFSFSLFFCEIVNAFFQ